MGEFDLQRPLPRGGAAAEDFENEAGAVKHLGAPLLLEVSLLDGRKLGVDDNQFGFRLLHAPGNFRDLARTEKCRGFGRCDGSDNRLLDFEVDGARQAYGFLQPGSHGAVGTYGCVAVTPVDVE